MRKLIILFIGLSLAISIRAQDQRLSEKPDDLIVVEGVIKESNGDPIIGAVVYRKKTLNIFSASDKDGHYSIKAAVNDTLVFSYIGFERQEGIVTESGTLDIIMAKPEKEKEFRPVYQLKAKKEQPSTLITVGKGPILIEGTVKDENGKNLTGVLVYVKGKLSLSTASNAEGRYSIRVNSNDILIFNYTGYPLQETIITENRTLDITLKKKKGR